MDELKHGVLALALALGSFSAAHARDQVGEKDAFTIDPAKSYIFFRTKTKAELRFLREVTPTQMEAWKADRDAAFAKARAQYEKKLVRWQREEEVYRKMSPYQRAAAGSFAKPQEVTLQNFGFPPAEMANFVKVAAGPQFSKNKPEYTYLLAVEPGTYSLYGNVAVTPNGMFGVCNCMGSVKFDARAGEIVDLGEVRYPVQEAIKKVAESKPTDRAAAFEQAARGLTAQAIVPASASMPLPQRLANLPVKPADFRAADKMPNFFGVLIDRLAPLPGVLAYQRDKVVDLKAEGSATASGRR
ncbi:MAG: hypothetical protein M3Q08_05175 [Pseudomonadota bacterium]|nr:hypothetical protein [Pseudomonadota bacterium]